MPDNSQMEVQGFSDNSRLRASDADRDRAASVINNAMAEGRLTADEHSERLDAIYSAKTHADIVPLLDDLPDHGAVAVPAPAGNLRPAGVPSGPPDRIVAVLSGATRKGTWQADATIDILNVLGGTELDFREAQLSSQETTIRITCVLGGVEITVPPEMHVVNSVVTILGGVESVSDSDEATQPGAPTLRLTGSCVLGGIEIKRKSRKGIKNSGRRSIGQ
jgi:hypothetical protein